MARPDVDAAQGVQMIAVSSNWSAQINNINHNNIQRGEIDTTHLLSTAKTNIPGDLLDSGEITGDFHWNSDNPPPVTSSVQTIILMNPAFGTYTGTVVTVSTNNTYTTITSNPGFEVFSGWFKSFSKKFPEDPAKMEGTFTLRLTGAYTKATLGSTVAA